MLSLNVHRFLLILALLAAAVPAAASAQDPVPVTPPVATTGAAESITRPERPSPERRPQRRRDHPPPATLTAPSTATTHLPLRVRHLPAYGLTTTETPVPEEGTDPVTVKVPITGLTRDTPYNFRLVATNPAGISRGANRTFRTVAGPAAARRHPGPPPATSPRAGARLTATVDPNALETSVRFEYGRTTRYGSFTGRVSAGAGDRGVPISIPLGGLRPEHPLPLPHRGDELGRHDAQPRPLVRHPARADRHLDRADPEPRDLERQPVRARPRRPARRWAARGSRSSARTGPSAPASARSATTRTANRDGSFRFDLPSRVRDHPVPRRDAHDEASSRARSGPPRARSRSARGAQRAGRRRRTHAGRDLAARPQRPGLAAEALAEGPLGDRPPPAAQPLDANRSRYSFSVKREEARRALPRRRACARRRRARARAEPRSARARAAQV